MGDPKESLHLFLGKLLSAPKDSKRRDAAYVRPSRVIRLSTERHDPDVGTVEVHGHTLEFRSDTVIWVAPALQLRATSAGRIVDSPFFDPLQRYASTLNGDEIEVDTAHAPDMGVVPLTNWDVWKWGDPGTAYRERIYPKTIEVVTSNLDLHGVDQPVCVDLFGGDGEFAELLANALQNKGAHAEIHIVDANIPSLERARARFQEEPEDKFVVHPPTDLVRQDDIFLDIHRPPDLVTALGGLCDGIVSRNGAIRVAEKVYDKLNNGGLFIATGYSPVLLNRAEFERVGFQVRQMSIPPNALTGDLPNQMYVMKK